MESYSSCPVNPLVAISIPRCSSFTAEEVGDRYFDSHSYSPTSQATRSLWLHCEALPLCYRTRKQMQRTPFCSLVSPSVVLLTICTDIPPAPRYGNLEGPLTAGGAAHPCFPWKVWKDLQDISSTSINHEGRCIPGCPGQTLVSSLNQTQHYLVD